MSMDKVSNNSVERIQSTYRIVLGATVSFLPFALFFLVQDTKIDFVPAVIFWILTFWIIISELWSIEDISYHYPTASRFRTVMSMIYLVILTMLPVALVLGLDKANVLEQYIALVVGEGRYNSVQPYLLIFVTLALVDLLLQYSYMKSVQERIDERVFGINMAFDCAIAIIYSLILVLFFAEPTIPVVWGAILLTGAYFLESLLNWIMMPRWFPDEYDE